MLYTKNDSDTVARNRLDDAKALTVRVYLQAVLTREPDKMMKAPERSAELSLKSYRRAKVSTDNVLPAVSMTIFTNVAKGAGQRRSFKQVCQKGTVFCQSLRAT
jgi:hypothetical protein